MELTWKSVIKIIVNWIVISSPFWLLPIAYCLGDYSEAKCAYVLFVLGFYWMFEAIPISVAALMPFVMFPMMGILPTETLSGMYFADINFLLLGGMIVALAVEETQLHERMALAVLCRLGSKPHWLMMGFMVVTAFLSMFMSNTAATAMMIPTTIALIDELITQRRIHLPKRGMTNITFVTDITDSEATMTDDVSMNTIAGEPQTEGDKKLELSKSERKLTNGFLLSICYASNIGGTATLIGTATNLILIGQLDRLFPGKDTGITFLSWMEMAFPAMIVSLFLAWLWLCLSFLMDFGDIVKWAKSLKLKKKKIKLEDKKDKVDPIKEILRTKYVNLGPMSFAEVFTAIIVVLLIILWLFRNPGFMTGWAIGFKRGYVTDSVPAVLLSLVFFIVPKDFNQLFHRGKMVEYLTTSHESILNWNKIESTLQWGVLLVMGSGFALAEGISSSGLSRLIGQFLTDNLKWIPAGGIGAIVAIIVANLTEIASNPATASISGPVVISLAQKLCVNPLYFALPANLAASFSFMLPVATPPNALVFGTGRVDNSAMMQAGVAMNFVCIGVMLLNLNTWTLWLFKLDSYPEWARMDNSTLAAGNYTYC